MSPDDPDTSPAELVAARRVRLSDWLRDQDARDLATFARAARGSDTSFLGHLLDDP